MITQIPFIDSHTGGEPTRLNLQGGPYLGAGTLAARVALFRSRHDAFRAAVVQEPRGAVVLVGALLCKPSNPQHTAGVIFFNNVGFLGMCGHGTIGLMASLAYLGRIEPGRHIIETPVGNVAAHLHADGRVGVENVPSYRHRRAVRVEVDGLGPVTGDIAWGGNWFFLVPAPDGVSLQPNNMAALLDLTTRIRNALERQQVTGADNSRIDHVELIAPSPTGADARTFVLCPGLAWDRSPCGTGTSAKLACLAADGLLQPQQNWKQESIIGSVFEAHYHRNDQDQVIPTVTGTAHIMAEGTLLLDDNDPFCWGLPR
jgi:4-hydroxyproline epimerase